MPKEVNQINVQPHSEEAELAVLGSMLSSKEAVSRAIGTLNPEDFYKEAHLKIFSIMQELFDNSEPIDTLSVSELLKKNNLLEAVGGTYFLTGLVESVPTSAHVEKYSKIVREKAILRNLIELSHKIAKISYDDDDDINNILDNVESAIFKITQSSLKTGFKQINPIMIDALDELEEKRKKGSAVTGVPSGLLDLDDKTSGFQKGDLIIVAGRPSMGKTALALSMIRNAAIEGGAGIGMFSLEMGSEQLAMRLLCAEARVNMHYVRTGKLPQKLWKNLSLATGDLQGAPIYIDDTPAITVRELRAKARRLKSEKDIDMIVVDYLQLMQGPVRTENRQQEISEISRNLKSLAKELNVPIIALSQLSRAVEQRNEKRPILSDLRESGAIEQDADIVIFLYRPWVYTKDDNEEGKAELIIAKQRNGPIGSIEATFISQYARFENLSKEDMPF